MTAKKTTKPLSKLEELERKVFILEAALYQEYDDLDEIHNLLAIIIKSLDSKDASIYQLKYALQGFRSLLISNQSLMMDCAGLEY